MSSALRAARKLRMIGRDFGATGLARYARKAGIERLALHADYQSLAPGHLQIEISGKCNLKCPFCPRTFSDEGWQDMPVAMYQKLIASAPGLWSVNLQGFGEPLLHPELEAIVAWTRGRDIEVGFATNGTLLDEKRSRGLIAARLSWLNVSMDGATAATYERLRVGARFARVLANLNGFVSANRDAGNPVRLTLVYVCVHSNMHEIPAFLELARAANVTRVFLAPVLDLTQEVAGERLTPADREALLAAPAAGATLGLEVQIGVFGDRVAVGELPCDWPWNKMYITSSGSVTPCCIEPQSSIGDAAAAGVMEVWNGEPYARLRRGLTSGDPHEICRKNCFVGGN